MSACLMRKGESVMAVIVKSNPDLTEEKIKDYCRKNLTAYKIPRTIIFVNELPKTNVGKILRREIRDKYVDH